MRPIISVSLRSGLKRRFLNMILMAGSRELRGKSNKEMLIHLITMCMKVVDGDPLLAQQKTI